MLGHRERQKCANARAVKQHIGRKNEYKLKSLMRFKQLIMILCKGDRLKKYLDDMGKTQSWLAQQLGWSKGYISQIVNNKCRVESIIDKLLYFTHLSFEELFANDGQPDKREFFGATIYEGEVALNNKAYKRKIHKNIFKKLLDKRFF
jgi:transcriptional regulator with XRE-family HTH domain